MSYLKTPLHNNLMTALNALPQDEDMKNTVALLDDLIIPNEDVVNMVTFIEILFEFRQDLHEQFVRTQLLMELHKNCLRRAELIRLKKNGF